MILTSEEAYPQIVEAVRAGELISDNVAQTVAGWYQSPAQGDVALCALAHGLEFDAVALLDRAQELIKSDEFKASDVLPELHALYEWALARVPHVEVTEYEVGPDDWEAWSDTGLRPMPNGEPVQVTQWGDTDSPEWLAPIDRDVTVVAHVQHYMGTWVYPGDAGYPADPHAEAFELDESDGSVWLPASVVDTGAAMLRGECTGFYAESYGGNPFAPGDFWWQSDTFDEIGPGKPYASRYVNPYTGDVQVKVARLVGFTPEQEADMYRAYRA